MPASSGVGIVSGPIETTLRASLGGGSSSDLDQRLISSSKRVLLHNIDFQKAENDSSYQLEALRSKYKSLNAGRNDTATGSENHTPKIAMKPKVEAPQINGVLPQRNKGNHLQTLSFNLFSKKKVIFGGEVSRGWGIDLP